MELTGFDVRAFLAEDVGDGDVTTEAVVPADARLDATLLLKERGVVCGLEVAEAVFRELDPGRRASSRSPRDGDDVQGEVARVSRQRARAAHRRAHRAEPARPPLRDRDAHAPLRRRGRRHGRDRSSTRARRRPGLRALEKLAVRAGGGTNHRFGLYDAVLIKDNHLRLGGGVAASVAPREGDAGCRSRSSARRSTTCARRSTPAPTRSCSTT